MKNMKTPRALLLSEHRAMEPALDQQRRQFLADLTNPKSSGATPGQWLALAWRELFLVNRRAWLGLAAVWLVIGALQLMLDEPPALAHVPVPAFPPPPMEDGMDYLYAHGYRAAGWWPETSRLRINPPPTEGKPPGPRGDNPRSRFGLWLETHCTLTEPQSV